MQDPGTAEPIRQVAKDVETQNGMDPTGDDDAEVLHFLKPRLVNSNPQYDGLLHRTFSTSDTALKFKRVESPIGPCPCIPFAIR